MVESMPLRVSSVSTRTHHPMYAASVPQTVQHPSQTLGCFPARPLRVYSSHSSHSRSTLSSGSAVQFATTLDGDDLRVGGATPSSGTRVAREPEFAPNEDF